MFDAGTLRGLRVLLTGLVLASEGLLLGAACSLCTAEECEGADGSCVSCPMEGTYCTTTPVGACSAVVNGVACCATAGAGPGSSSGSDPGGCTSQVCCGGLFECNGACYSTCTPGSQPCCTATNCTCFTPCC